MVKKLTKFSACFCTVLIPVKKLALCEDLERSSCGTVLFQGYLPPPGKSVVHIMFVVMIYVKLFSQIGDMILQFMFSRAI